MDDVLKRSESSVKQISKHPEIQQMAAQLKLAAQQELEAFLEYSGLA